MDDIKQFTKNEKELETLIQAVKTYNDDIGMEFGREKCVMRIMKSRKRQRSEGLELTNQEEIRTLWEKETYKYLGILEADTIKPQENEKTTLQEPYKRINTWAVLLARYSGPFLVEQKRTPSNRPVNKKTHYDA